MNECPADARDMFAAHTMIRREFGLVVAEMPAEVQPVIKDLGAAAYANYAQQLYGTATPPRVTG